ncbi:uncharacterized protein BX664DRAFT_338171 [Halteromyces radiatus]|uniref:uncharacterized protein n=1 Tax=Halteromyces radiatus TaxID=101107 RepID=UPI00221FCC43|nr:uncharacterized protein BX664DRAFT_338171 [Halteromyces radiatus]KAI8084952.1 hypothetical protein BX664DRAFT_338171 [Halteromyces radiatus]
MSKRVQFSCDVVIESTFANEDYDRTAQEVAKLTYSDMVELLTMKSQWRRDTEQMINERANREKEQQKQQEDLLSQQEENHQPSVFTTAQEICT